MDLLDKYPKGRYFDYTPIFRLNGIKEEYNILGEYNKVGEASIGEMINELAHEYEVSNNIKIVVNKNSKAILKLKAIDDLFLDVKNEGNLIAILEGDIDNVIVSVSGSGKFYIRSNLIPNNYAIKLLGGYGSFRIDINALKDVRILGRALAPNLNSNIELVANIVHNRPTYSEIDFRGVSKGYVSLRARSVLNEENSGSKINIKLINFNKGSVLPYLEVNTGEVIEAYHSGSIEYITEEIIDYLRHRGLTNKDIETLVVREFLGF